MTLSFCQFWAQEQSWKIGQTSLLSSHHTPVNMAYVILLVLDWLEVGQCLNIWNFVICQFLTREQKLESRSNPPKKYATVFTGGSKGGTQRMHTPPLGPNSLIFMQFLGKF